MAVEFEWESVVVGTSLNAAVCARESNSPIIFNKEPAFFKFKKLEDGSCEYEKWQELISSLALDGLAPFSDKVTSIRVQDDGLEIYCNIRKYFVHCKNIKFFDDDNIENFPFDRVAVRNYHVCDWFQVTSGTKHEHWLLEDEDDFVKKIHFVPKITLPKYKDCVTESFINKDRLSHVDYTSTMARHKTTQMMKEAGIVGTKHTRTYYLPIKMKLVERQVFEIKEEIVQKTNNYILDTREFK